MKTLYVNGGMQYSEEDEYVIMVKDYGVVVYDEQRVTCTTYPWHRVFEIIEDYAE